MARIGVHDASVWTFSPYPGSELFERLRAAGRLPRLDDDYYASLLSYSDVSRRRLLRRRARFGAAPALPPGRAAALLRRELPHPSGASAALALQHRHAPLRVAAGDVVRQPGAPRCRRRARRSRRRRCASRSSPAASSTSASRRSRRGCARRATSRRWCTRRGRSRRGAAPIRRLLARLLDPQPEETADAHRRDAAGRRRLHVVQRHPSLGDRGGAGGEAALRRRRSSSAGRTCRRLPSARSASGRSTPSSRARARARCVDLIECAERGRFGRTDVANCTFKGDGGPIRNPVRPLIADLDALPWADKHGFYDAVPAFEREFYVVSRRGCPFRCSFCEYSTFPRQYPGEKPVRRRSVEHLIAELALLEGARPRAQGLLLGRDLHARPEVDGGVRRGVPARDRHSVRVLHAPADDDARHGALARRGRLHHGAGRRAERELRHARRRRPQGRPREGGADAALPRASTTCPTRSTTSSACPARAPPTSSTRCASTPRCSRSGSSPIG